jgi:hypothetical protein
MAGEESSIVCPRCQDKFSGGSRILVGLEIGE